MFSCFLIPLFEKIDTLLEKHGDFDSLQKFRLSVGKYYLKHDSNTLSQNFNLDLLLKKILEFDLALRYTTCVRRVPETELQDINHRIK
jgi:hypothetical protein